MRKQRHAAFQAPQTGSITMLSVWLLACGESELQDALAERGPGVASGPENHWSPHALASILLLVAGFEAWLNESTMLLEYGSPGLRKLADKSVEEKYREIPKLVAGNSPIVDPDLPLLLKVRHEIAHFLPITVQGAVPPWLAGLQERGLFITSSEPTVDYDFGAKLASYALAYWAWETISEAVAAFVDALGDQGRRLRPTIVGFEAFRSACPPGSLSKSYPVGTE